MPYTTKKCLTHLVGYNYCAIIAQKFLYIDIPLTKMGRCLSSVFLLLCDQSRERLHHTVQFAPYVFNCTSLPQYSITSHLYPICLMIKP